jgi:hypothetical protein
LYNSRRINAKKEVFIQFLLVHPGSQSLSLKVPIQPHH